MEIFDSGSWLFFSFKDTKNSKMLAIAKFVDGLFTTYRTSFSSVFGSVATTADADLTMGGATYTKEDVLGKGLYNRGADTST